MLVRNQKDFAAGLLFAAIGTAFALGAREYSMGTSARMGPGYFPLMLGIILAIIGVVLAVKSFRGEHHEGRIGAWAIKPLFFVILANLLFGVLLGGLPTIGLPSMGLMVAIFVLTLVAARAGSEFVLKEAFILGVILAIGSYFLFVKMLSLPFQVWPAFIAG